MMVGTAYFAVRFSLMTFWESAVTDARHLEPVSVVPSSAPK
jgi:hypothetical protein